MSERSSFYRKIAYGVAIAALLFPLSLMSSPATMTEQGLNPGGKLAQLRDEYRLGQANLGEIDPASETMKLATLGLRGVAMNLLWEKANYYKKTEDWSNLTATLDQLAKLQPNFITFWKFQSWNISYNVSVEFDDYRDRYYYVRRGIDFLKTGESYNEDNPHLLWDLGWFIGQKIGRADEYLQYRRLFKADDDFHPEDRPPEKRDNWLVGKEWYLTAIDAVDNKGRSIGKKSPKVFYSSPAMSQINYAEAIEKEGFFNKARRAWSVAADQWRDYGDLTIEHSTGVKLHLNGQQSLEKEVARLIAELDALIPGIRAALAEEKIAELPDEQREAVNLDVAERSSEQMELAYLAQQKMNVTHRDVAEQITSQQPELANEVFKLVSELEQAERQLRFTVNYKRDSNFDYWKLRCDFEQTPEALRAREMMYLGHKAFEDEGDLVAAQQLYDEGFAAWRDVLDQFPTLLDDETTTGDDLMEYITEYREILDQLDESLGEDFQLWDIIESFDAEQQFAEELHLHKQQLDEAADQSALNRQPDEATAGEANPAGEGSPSKENAPQ
jgi:hypothetical protein